MSNVLSAASEIVAKVPERREPQTHGDTKFLLGLPELRSADKKRRSLCLRVFVVQRFFAFCDFSSRSKCFVCKDKRLLIVNNGLSVHVRLDKLPLVDITIANGRPGKMAGPEHGIAKVSVGDNQMVQATPIKAWGLFHTETIRQKALTEIDLIERGVVQLSIP